MGAAPNSEPPAGPSPGSKTEAPLVPLTMPGPSDPEGGRRWQKGAALHRGHTDWELACAAAPLGASMRSPASSPRVGGDGSLRVAQLSLFSGFPTLVLKLRSVVFAFSPGLVMPAAKTLSAGGFCPDAGPCQSVHSGPTHWEPALCRQETGPVAGGSCAPGLSRKAASHESCVSCVIGGRARPPPAAGSAYGFSFSWTLEPPRVVFVRLSLSAAIVTFPRAELQGSAGVERQLSVS